MLIKKKVIYTGCPTKKRPRPLLSHKNAPRKIDATMVIRKLDLRHKKIRHCQKTLSRNKQISAAFVSANEKIVIVSANYSLYMCEHCIYTLYAPASNFASKLISLTATFRCVFVGAFFCRTPLWRFFLWDSPYTGRPTK